MKEYMLMHKENIVGGIVFNSRWQICSFKPSRKDLLPICAFFEGKLSIDRLNRWFLTRNMSVQRVNYEQLKENTGKQFIEEIIVKSGAFSLFDSYWIKEKNSIHSWSNNNYYQNSYENDITAAFAKGNFDKRLQYGSPTLTVPGDINYVWQRNKEAGNMLFCFADKEYVLTEYFLCQEAAPLFGLPSVSMALSKKDAEFCAFPIFTSETTEYVPASYILNSGEREGKDSQHQHFLKRCRELNIPGYKNFLDTLICFDYVFHITNRNYDDFGFLRDNDTQKFIGPAPVYHNGYGLFHEKELSENEEMLENLFFENIGKRIMQINDPAYLSINFEKLDELPDRIYNLFSYDKKKAELKSEMVRRRIRQLPKQFSFLIEKKASLYQNISQKYQQNDKIKKLLE